MTNKQEFILGIDREWKRTLGKTELPQFETYTLVYLTQHEIEAIMSIPDWDMEAIQQLLSKYY